MSMAVDLSKPLDDETRSYLAMRGRYAEIERADGQNDVTPPEPDNGDGTGPAVTPLLTSEARANRRAQLERELEDLDRLDGEESDPGQSGSVEDGDVDPYETWTVKALDAEIKHRNQNGADIPTGGDKSSKVAALYENDEKANTDDESPEA